MADSNVKSLVAIWTSLYKLIYRRNKTINLIFVVLNFIVENQNIFPCLIFSQYIDDAGIWIPSSWKTRSCLSCIVDTMSTDVLVFGFSPNAPAWISNRMPSKSWDEITYPLPNVNGSTDDVRLVITHPVVWDKISYQFPNFNGATEQPLKWGYG